MVSQQVAVCASPLPTQLLLALLGGGGAAAVVCPRNASASASSSMSLGEAAASPGAAPGTPGLAGASNAAVDEDMTSTFFVALYAGLKGGASLTGALAAAEAAQPALAGVYGLHGMRDGALVVLPELTPDSL